MVEVTATYDFFPGADQKAWAELAKNSMGPLLRAPGFVELRANRNLAGSPQIRTSYVFQSLADWGMFAESPEYRTLEPEMRRFITNIDVKIWGPSPVAPEPVRSKQAGDAGVEFVQTHDLLPGIDPDAYAGLNARAVGLLLEAPGFVEFRGHRNLLGSPQVRATSAWRSMADVATFVEGAAWRTLEPDMRTYVANITVRIWGPSPVVPDPIRPG